MSEPEYVGMKRFQNIWDSTSNGPASACIDCGTVVFTYEQLREHRCPVNVKQPYWRMPTAKEQYSLILKGMEDKLQEVIRKETTVAEMAVYFTTAIAELKQMEHFIANPKEW